VISGQSRRSACTILIFDFRGQFTAENIEPAKVRDGGHSAGGPTTVGAAVMVQ